MPRSRKGRRLGGKKELQEFKRVYHGTSANKARSIRDTGYRPSATGVYGPGVYTGNKKMAQEYADSAGKADKSGGRVLAHRVPAKNHKTVPFEKGDNPRVSPQKDLVQKRLRQGKTTRIDYGKGSHVTNLTKQQADKSLIPSNGQIRLTKAQQAKLRADKARDAAAKPQSKVGKPLGGQSKRTAFRELYHGTSPEARQTIQREGFRQGGGKYGDGVYASSNRNTARAYQRMNSNGNVGDTGLVRLRVPAKSVKNVRSQAEYAKARRNPSPAGEKSPVREVKEHMNRPGAKAARVPDGAVRSRGELTRPGGGMDRKGDYVIMDKDYASSKVVKTPANRFRPNNKQQLRAIKDKTPATRLSHDSVRRSESGYFKPGSRQVDQRKAADLIEKQVKGLQKGGGFTVDPRTGRVPTRGTQVAIDGRVLRDTSREGIERFVRKNADLLSRPDVKVGGWTSDRSGKPVIELSRRTRSQAEAERLGKKFQQEGVWNNQQGQYQPTGGTDQLRHTKGAQTRGGGRIGGQGATAHFKSAARPGTIAKPISGKQTAEALKIAAKPGVGKQALRFAGRAAGPAMTALDFADRKAQGQSTTKAATGSLGGTAGAFAGGTAGAKAGATAGAFLGPKGALVGGLLGGLGGSIAGYTGADYLNDSLYKSAPKRTKSQQQKNREKMRRLHN